MQQLEERVVYSVSRAGWVDRLAQDFQQVLHQLFRGSEVGRRAKDFLNGVWLAHPLHPAVTDVPVGAWTTAFILDSVESVTRRRMGQAASGAIAVGIGGALVSAASGLADWEDTYGDQRRVGLLHALTNTLALSLYSASLWSRLTGRRGARALSGAGFATVFVGAYLGGELAYRLGTQVDRDAYFTGVEEFTPALGEAELIENQPRRVDVRGIPVMLVRQAGAIYALNDVCSHAGCSLSEGRLEGDSIQCRCHGSTYKLIDGKVIHGPSPYPQPSYRVRVRDGQIEVQTTLQ